MCLCPAPLGTVWNDFYQQTSYYGNGNKKNKAQRKRMRRGGNTGTRRPSAPRASIPPMQPAAGRGLWDFLGSEPIFVVPEFLCSQRHSHTLSRCVRRPAVSQQRQPSNWNFKGLFHSNIIFLVCAKNKRVGVVRQLLLWYAHRNKRRTTCPRQSSRLIQNFS